MNDFFNLPITEYSCANKRSLPSKQEREIFSKMTAAAKTWNVQFLEQKLTDYIS